MTRVLLGTYTDFVYDVEFTPPTESSPPKIEKIRDLPIGWGASWLTRHPKHKDIWYVALEADDDGGVKLNVEGHVAAYRITEDTCEELCKVSVVHNPCHVEVVGDCRGVAVANYSMGTAMLIPIDADGLFVEPKEKTFLKYEQLGKNPPRCHQCVDVPATGECWVVDCGNWCVWRMALKGSGSDLAWEIVGKEDVSAGYAARQIVVSPDARHLYSLHAGSCLVSHHDLAAPADKRLVSMQNMLPPPHSVNMATRQPPFTSGAALTLHAPSSTLTASSRLIKGEKVDSIACFKVNPDASLGKPTFLRPSRGREYRGVGFVGDCLLVAGQEDGWMSCFQWDKTTDAWEEKLFDTPVNLPKVVDIKVL